MAFRIATFNTGLAVGVLPHATERLPRIVDALRELALETDVLYVQELWLESHWELLRNALATTLPHAMRPTPLLGSVQGACGEAEIRPFTDCARASCAGLRDEALARCAISSCSHHALVLAPPCLNCLASHPVGTLDEIVERCVHPEATAPPARATPSAAPTAASRYAGLMAYGGSFGTGVLCRSPIETSELRVFPSSVNARGAMYLRTRSAELGAVDLFATHLSPGGPDHPTQIGELLAWIESLVGDGPAVLLGDLNTTPGSNAFRRLEQAGFREPALADTRSTFAPDGLGTGHVSESGWRLDHILLRGIRAPARTARILDHAVEIDVAGRTVRTTLSDHLGLLATLG